jgi:hypothetical protein
MQRDILDEKAATIRMAILAVAVRCRTGADHRQQGNASRRDRRLCIKPPLVVGDRVKTPTGLVYELLDEFHGVARQPIAKHKRIVPRVLVWGFFCSACGEQAKTACVASEKPIAVKCTACLSVRRRAR